MKLFAFGLGFSAQELASRFAARGWQIAGTARDEGNLAKARAQGYQMARFAGEPGNRDVTRLLQGTTHLVHSIPPGHDGDPVLAHYRDQIATIGTLEWIGYLSTVGVYGDQEGRWVDETTPPKPNSDRTEARVEAEEAWLQFGEETGIPTHVFRLAHLWPGEKRLRQADRRHGEAHHERWPGVQPHPCRRHRERARGLDRAAAGRRHLQCRR
jgi:nucleoside-diphosphate-sugar epimerase